MDIHQPFPWYISGPLIGFIMFLLLLIGKKFGMSSNLRTLCAVIGAGKTCNFFQFDWKTQRWNLVVVIGAMIGGYIAVNYLSGTIAPAITPETIDNLKSLGFESAGDHYMPIELFEGNPFANIKQMVILLLGGLLVGFGARYAGGCTSGHAISGLSNLQIPSLIAVIGFFIGGLVMIHGLFPLIF